MLTRIMGRLGRLLTGDSFPRRVVINDFFDRGITFEVTNATEAYRVEQFGGEREFLAQLLGEIRSDDVVYDVGACVGLMALHAARVARQVVAFEPDPGFRDRLYRNIELNSVNNITVLPYAVSDESGTADLRTEGVSGNSPRLAAEEEGSLVEVETVTLDELASSGEAPAPDIVKFDIEGAEFAALRGMDGLLRSSRRPRVIQVEVHPDFLVRFDSSAEEVSELFAETGYEPRYRARREGQIHYVYRRRQ